MNGALVPNENLHNAIVDFLERRGRWVRAGNDNIVKYLSFVTQCGPNRLQEIREVLTSPSEVLYVEHDRGYIRLVGLAVWVNDRSISATEISADAAENQHTDDTFGFVEQPDSNIDIDEVLAMAIEQESIASALKGQLTAVNAELEALQQQLAQPGTSDSEEVAELRRQLVGVNSVVTSLRGALSLKGERYTELENETKGLRRLRKLEPLLDDPAVMAAIEQILAISAQFGDMHFHVVNGTDLLRTR